MFKELSELLQTVDGRPTPAAYLTASRQLDRLRDRLQPVRVALLSSFTIEPLKPYLQVEGARQGLAADVYVGKFNTVRQELLDPAGECVAYQPDVVFVAELLCDVCPPLATDFLTLTREAIDELIDETVDNVASAVSTFRRSSSAAVIVHNFTMPRRPVLGLYDAMADLSEGETISQLNRRLARELSRIPGAYMLDVCTVAAHVGHRHWYDDRMWFLARAPLAAPALEALAREQAKVLRVLRLPARKCLALDLDNTLWGGVLGEAGTAGIALGSGYPGNTYRQFQESVLQLYRQGVVLALVSKNNQSDVDEVFRTHPDMVLKPEHFAATRINWKPKPENLIEIADELSLNVDSFVFFDDDAAECSLMRQALPEVLTVQAPQDASRFFDALVATGAFERLSMTSEDLRRGQMYRERAARTRAAGVSGSITEFLQSLDMSASIRPIDAFAFPRVVNLIEKTNQFNLTTRRHSAAELHAMAADPRQAVFSLQVADRFGDNGIVGVAILRHHDRTVDVDTLLLSCRVIGRTVETALLAFVVEWAQERGAEALEGEFIPTAKNAPSADFYARHGFQRIAGNDGAASRWRLTLAETSVRWPSYIQLQAAATA